MSYNLNLFPAVVLRGMTIFPGTVAHFDISNTRDIHAVEQAMVGQEQVFLVTQKNLEADRPEIGDLYEVGVVARVRQVIKMNPGIVRVLVEGLYRGRLEMMEMSGEYNIAEVYTDEEEDECPARQKKAMMDALIETVGKYALATGRAPKDYRKEFSSVKEARKLIYSTLNYFPIEYEKRQEILETPSLEEAYERTISLFLNEIEVATIKQDFEAKVHEKVDKNQKDYILREQMRVIREELGDEDTESDAESFRRRTAELDAPEEIKEKLNKEISRFEKLSEGSSEGAVCRGYIETLLELPWNVVSRDSTDIKRAAKILDEDHYGLDEVKERILEFLAVRLLTDKGETPIICLVGPPGTGKTSIARSVARALDKKFVRIHLGGVRDEAEIRGHRRTYVGAMPGRIASGLKYAGVSNPLMLLDEIDKVSNDYKGDTFSALLEVLDPDQNVRFADHYVEVPIDLSEVLFIATANTTSTIPRPLLDRMEVIEVSGYTMNEKLHIVSEHLIDKQFKKNGLTRKQLSIGKPALARVISGYTREAGVRNLERRIGQICRKSARKIMEDGEKKVKVTTSNLEEFLGKQKYTDLKKNSHDEVGIVRGLAWTSVGGDTLQVEVNIMPGKGGLLLTGKLGDVMKESAQAGVSYIRSIIDKYGVDKKFFTENDIHIHVPEGAVPKDGPSAGITMATAMFSAITGRKVRCDVAMTGEITLRGRVLPVGGLKEKLLAAKTAGMKTVIVPAQNRPDIEELSEEITGGMEIVYADSMSTVVKTAVIEEPAKAKKPGRPRKAKPEEAKETEGEEAKEAKPAKAKKPGRRSKK